MDGGTVFFDGFTVSEGAVAGVGIPGELRILDMQLTHVFIPVRFRQDAGGGDALVFPVSFDDAGIRHFAVGEEEFAVDEQEFRLHS